MHCRGVDDARRVRPPKGNEAFNDETGARGRQRARCAQSCCSGWSARPPRIVLVAEVSRVAAGARAERHRRRAAASLR